MMAMPAPIISWMTAIIGAHWRAPATSNRSIWRRLLSQ